mmetsp:Transcript_14693/g.29872  ORF Transcript_14693/g.29872 Transcript_14693/m.29872 type:complete len:434 (+) Transcript_14693:51-1352(+)
MPVSSSQVGSVVIVQMMLLVLLLGTLSWRRGLPSAKIQIGVLTTIKNDSSNGSNSNGNSQNYSPSMYDKWNETGLQFARSFELYGEQQRRQHQEQQPATTTIVRKHVCQGPRYDDFARQLHEYANQTALHGPDWGRRGRRQRSIPTQQGLPSHHIVIAVGNSHLRQIIYALLGQEQQQVHNNIQRVTSLYHHFAIRVDLYHQTTVYVLANTHVPYSDDWQAAIENLTSVALRQHNNSNSSNSNSSNIDNVVNHPILFIIGNHNACQTHYLDKFESDFPNISCTNPPPTVQDWIQAYPNSRLLFVTSFMGRHFYQQDVEWAQTVLQAGRDNVGFIYARHHLETIQHEGSENENNFHDNNNDDDDDNNIHDAACPICNVNGHRCVGLRGGYPDLVAWDIIEWIWTGMDSTNYPFAPRPFMTQVLQEIKTKKNDTV